MDSASHLCWGHKIPVHGATSPRSCWPQQSPAGWHPLSSLPSFCPSFSPSFFVLPSPFFLSFPLPYPHQAAAGRGRSRPVTPSRALLGRAAAGPGSLLPTTRPALCVGSRVLPCSTTATPTPNTPLQQRKPPPQPLQCPAWLRAQRNTHPRCSALCSLGCGAIRPPPLPKQYPAWPGVQRNSPA